MPQRHDEKLSKYVPTWYTLAHTTNNFFQLQDFKPVLLCEQQSTKSSEATLLETLIVLTEVNMIPAYSEVAAVVLRFRCRTKRQMNSTRNEHVNKSNNIKTKKF